MNVKGPNEPIKGDYQIILKKDRSISCPQENHFKGKDI